MSITGKIKTLFSDKNKTEVLFPRTKVSAVSDDNGVGLNVLLEQTVPMTRGGTGATNGAEGLANMFAAGSTVLSPYQYGTELPANAAVGQVYFEEATGTLADFEPEVVNAMRAVNLLDNSDFTNPVNQRGLEKYITNSGNTIDRWYGWHDNTNVHVSVQSGHVKVWSENTGSNASFTQRFPAGTFSDDKQYTFAYKTYEGNLVVVNNPISHHTQFDYVGFSLKPNQTINIVWAALYEGEYTAETLPPYVPKGYGAELLECQRYFLTNVGYSTTGRFIATSNEFQMFVPIPIKMRATPTVTIKNTDNIIANINGSASVVAVNSVKTVALESNGVVVTLNTSGNAGNHAIGSTYSTKLEFSADL